MTVGLSNFALAGIIAGALALSACQTGGLPAAGTGPASGAISTASAASNPKVLRHDAQAARLINAYRSDRGLGPVRIDETLTKIAAAHALDLARNGLTGHYGSDGSDPAQRASRNGYVFVNLGENTSAGRTTLADVIQAWIKSPTHQPNMVLNPAKDFGLAHIVAPGSRYRDYWVLMVGQRRPAGGGGFQLRNGFTGGFSGPRVTR
ncbi:hypothetical protein MNBD_ALPHA09-1979 [hydrothermal vent metagenome]|uniref:SCP domain-containing protein n=1 Tax=hydrothermal vent metagenome TaxID=652676 RepID=A0A3B0TBX6_9ZZZZ